MAFIITENCTKDEKCVEVCPADCIHPRGDESGFAEAPQLYVDAAGCIDCGACVPVCEASAIFAESDVPGEYLNAAENNVKYFQ